MKKSDEYMIDTLKNIGVGLIVAAIIGLFMNQQNVPDWKLLYTLVWGILINGGGYLYVFLKERR